MNSSNQVSFRWTREAVITERDSIEGDLAVIGAARHENDSGDQVFSASWASVLNDRTTNELKFGHVRENLLQGPEPVVRRHWKFIGFAGIDPSTSARATRIRTTTPACGTAMRRI